MPLLGKQIDPVSMFGGPFGGAPQGAIDLEAFEKITSGDLAFKRMNWLRNYDPVLRGFHAPSDMQRMWRAVFRASIAHGMPVPTDMIPYARALGVVIPASP